MKPIKTEFSRPFSVNKLPNSGSHQKLSASATERAALAKRMQVPTIHALEAKLLVKSWRGGGVRVTGDVTVDLDQMSVISLEAFRQSLDLPVERVFLPPGSAIDVDADDDLDVIDGGTIDLGELVAETLALELDPYPRKPGEVFASGEEPQPEAEPNPFSSLKGLPGGKSGK